MKRIGMVTGVVLLILSLGYAAMWAVGTDYDGPPFAGKDSTGHRMLPDSRPVQRETQLLESNTQPLTGSTMKELKLANVINRTCPRSGKPVVANSLATYRGVTVGFCNQHCRDDFAGNIDERPDDRKFFDDILAQRE